MATQADALKAELEAPNPLAIDDSDAEAVVAAPVAEETVG